MISDTAAMDQGQASWTALRRFMRPPAPAERCELCSAALAPEHQHLVDPATRQLLCACDACAILFSRQAKIKYRRVPRRIRLLEDFRLTDAQWDSLGIPIGLAFFLYGTAAAKTIAIYPSPGGPTESLLDLDTWDEIVQENPVLRLLEPDTEALLVNRIGQARQYYLAPIDQCYRLVGLLRAHWRGLSGGPEVWREIEGLFVSLKQKSLQGVS